MWVRAIAVAIFLAGCSSAHPPVAQSAPIAGASYRVHDLTPTFWRFWQKAEHAPEAEQVTLLEKDVIAVNPDVYTAEVIGLDPDKPFETELRARWPKFLGFAGKSLPVARDLSASIGRELGRYDAHFRETFPDFAYDGDVYFLVSLGGFDGGLRKVNGRTALLFGVDIIAAVNGPDANVEAFFDHELFHVYHRQFLDPVRDHTLAGALWTEGIAEYVADRLNPGTSEANILGLPRSSPARVRADLPGLASRMRAQLDSRSEEEYGRWFLGSEEGRNPPARAGYTLGYLVAKRVAGKRSLAELARLRGPALRDEIDRALASFTRSRAE